MLGLLQLPVLVAKMLIVALVFAASCQARPSSLLELSKNKVTLETVATPSITLLNAAVPGTQMPIVGLGTGGYGNASGYGGEHWDDEYGQSSFCCLY